MCSAWVISVEGHISCLHQCARSRSRDHRWDLTNNVCGFCTDFSCKRHYCTRLLVHQNSELCQTQHSEERELTRQLTELGGMSHANVIPLGVDRRYNSRLLCCTQWGDCTQPLDDIHINNWMKDKHC